VAKIDKNKPHMRIEILIDSETGDYQISVMGELVTIKEALRGTLEGLEDPEVIKKLVEMTEENEGFSV